MKMLTIGEEVKVTLNSNHIKNSTLAKLTADEICELGLCNIGIGLYRGELKTRYNGMKRIPDGDKTFRFEGQTRDVIFTEIISTEDRKMWAARIWNKEFNGYETYPMGITGCYFLRG